MPKVTVGGDPFRELAEGEPIGSILPEEAIAATVEGRAVDLSYVPDRDVDVAPIHWGQSAAKEIRRHSAAHIMAQAVCDLFPGAKYAIGPAIDDGFYYDFELADTLTPEDLPK